MSKKFTFCWKGQKIVFETKEELRREILLCYKEINKTQEELKEILQYYKIITTFSTK